MDEKDIERFKKHFEANYNKNYKMLLDMLIECAKENKDNPAALKDVISALGEIMTHQNKFSVINYPNS